MMNREWRSEAWRTTHPISLYAKFKHSFFRFLKPFRKLAGKITFVDQTNYIDVAAKWKAVQNIEGDYCEFGVYTARQFIHAYKTISRITLDA